MQRVPLHTTMLVCLLTMN